MVRMYLLLYYSIGLSDKSLLTFSVKLGALFAFAILGEHLTSWGMIGASLITLAAMVNVMFALVFVQKS